MLFILNLIFPRAMLSFPVVFVSGFVVMAGLGFFLFFFRFEISGEAIIAANLTLFICLFAFSYRLDEFRQLSDVSIETLDYLKMTVYGIAALALTPVLTNPSANPRMVAMFFVLCGALSSFAVIQIRVWLIRVV